MMMSHQINHVGLVLLFLLMVSSAQDTCPASSRIHGIPGLPGIPGSPGKDGLDGLPGMKGIPGVPGSFGIAGRKGEKGEQGIEGTVGRSGPDGEKGEKGEKGAMGKKGQKGEIGEHTQTLKAAFSVARSTNNKPKSGTTISFGKINNEFRNVMTQDGKFQCTIPGLYYFTYHATSKGSLCISFMLNKEKVVTFCDKTYNTFQVSSGGVILQLNTNDVVTLQTNKFNSMQGFQGVDSIFSGFLI
ncbi:complement C1q subcomponent subunit B-like [Narcine bancroftii]|uniref:complement C1q subcomponent subunit B-like n=1 Tax=Narcine bancroftii TaxID=1343680 RepID=UPI0038319874